MKFFLSVGEPSGDLHGANLVRTLRAHDPGAEVIGFGGPKMAAAGAELLFPLTELALMRIGGVLKHLPTFFRLADDAERCFRKARPDALVLIDYPEFNFVLAARAHALGIPVYYFVPPQIWAWRRGRARKVRKWCSAVLSALPFEDDWYRARGVPTHYVGHPYFDELAQQRLDRDFIAAERAQGGQIIGLLPGSRNQEVVANFDMMVKAARTIHAARPDTRFRVAAFNDRHAATARQIIAANGGERLPIEVHVGRTPEIIEMADACVAVSGSVSLELMYRATPTMIIYRMNPASLWLARRLVKLKSITLVNMLAGERLFPEIATSRDESPAIARQVLEWLDNPNARQELVGRLAALRDRVARPGACDRAAEFLTAAAAERRASRAA